MPTTRLVVGEPGLQTTVQDERGRLGYWMVGVPPSGAMDPLSLALANRIVGNRANAAGLECTVRGPTVTFTAATTFALAGAAMAAKVDGHAVPFWQPIPVPAGAALSVGGLIGPGMRCYLAVQGGLDVAEVLGSRATFSLGGFGGHEGRDLQRGDEISIGAELSGLAPFPLRPLAQPRITSSWTLRVLAGPHGDPEFFTPEGIEELHDATWEVQTHSARTGVRLTGPTPGWARSDGGEAGLHPSNIHDTGYAFGAVDFTGDTPVILGPDGPSLGGFTCPFTVASAERWKLGQLAPGDEVRLRLISDEGAGSLRAEHSETVARLRPPIRHIYPPVCSTRDGGVLARRAATSTSPEVAFRRAGDDFVLVELGPMTLDLELRARVHALDQWVQAGAPEAVIDLTAGVRSLLVHFDPDVITAPEVMDLASKGLEEIGEPSELVIEGRTVWMPLSWEDPSTLEAIERYMKVVRDDAPWCPSNLEFIRRVNGLDSVDDVRRIVFDASYLVLGLGDVYLGAPVATPVDPRHRLITTKYNPARTWTPQNAVGIGGAYLCVYGMEGPGGYQFVGRTVPVWYLDSPTPGPDPDTPWLLRPFDQLRFHPVTTEELAELRARAVDGTLELDVTPTQFSVADHQRFLDDAAGEIAAFRTRQSAAFDAERARWRERGELSG